jgi:hypothetical protein
MKLIAFGVPLMLGGLALLFAMVVRSIEPGLWLSLLGYAAMFAGAMLAIVGTVEALRRR